MVKLVALALMLTLVPAAVALMPAPVCAQDGATDHKRARRLFKEGVALAKSERWAEALSSFRQSAALVPRPSTSYNIANALYRLDRPVQALAELDTYDEMRELRDDPAAQARGAALRKLVAGAIGRVRFTLTPPTASLFIDGRPSSAVDSSRWLTLNPGTHSIRVTHTDYHGQLQEIQVERGSRRAYKVVLLPKEAAQSPPAVDAERKPFVKRPGFWLTLGAIVVVGVGTGVGIAIARKGDSTPCGTTGACATTQGMTVTSF